MEDLLLKENGDLLKGLLREISNSYMGGIHDLGIGAWSPGDGWTRYYLECKSCGQPATGYLRRKEMNTFLHNYLRMIRGNQRCVS